MRGWVLGMGVGVGGSSVLLDQAVFSKLMFISLPSLVRLGIVNCINSNKLFIFLIHSLIKTCFIKICILIKKNFNLKDVLFVFFLLIICIIFIYLVVNAKLPHHIST